MADQAIVYILAAVALIFGAAVFFVDGHNISPNFKTTYRPDYEFCCQLTPEAKWDISISSSVHTDIETRDDARVYASEECKKLNKAATLYDGHCALR